MRSLLLAFVMACGAPTVATPRPARLQPCTIEGVAEPLRCGTLEVWENRARREGRKIALKIVVVPSTSATPAPDPLFAFAGGPGAFATESARGWAQDRGVRAHRDIVLVDQRGTGGSHRLDCKVPRDPADLQGYLEPPLPVAEVKRCRDELSASADLTQYTTTIAADDLDEVRAWLGYDQINIQGASYGTRMAQVYLRQHGDHVRTATLMGVVGMDQLLPLYHARDGKAAIDRVFAACARMPACAAAYPDLANEHVRVLAALDRERGRATVEVDHRAVSLTISHDAFAEQMRFLTYSAGAATMLPYVVHRAAEGDFAPFARLALRWEPGFRDSLAYGMHLSVTCAEDVPFIAPFSVEPAVAGTYLRGYRIDQQLAACKAWPRGAAPARFHEPVISDVPVLLVSGPYDPVTPPRWAEGVARKLSHGLHVIIPEGHHGPGGLSHLECYDGLQAAFLERGTTDGLDTSCVATMARPPFVVDEAGFASTLASD